jgi:aspartyl-tRNA(Asn)/glutamyl-tRNA(Gln) amidotransferase subunit C
MGKRMKIDEATVRHVARLAELAVADADLPVLARQLAGIVALVEQLEELPLASNPDPVVMGPSHTPLRDDVVNPIPMAHGPAEFAPGFEYGFFTVPRLGGLAPG